MARPSYKSEKRKKEIARQKKQEEKRQKRFSKSHEPDGAPLDAATLEGLGLLPPGAASAGAEQTEGAENASETADSEEEQEKTEPGVPGSNT
ncbi:MAG: hypothetical protein IMZ55_19650 [Acidobacteria bacterium]|nr:hypothetical protein [Acidobacteriota bacterium]